MSVGTLPATIERWPFHAKEYSPTRPSERRSISRIWYRGNPQKYTHPLRPKVYREPFVKRAAELFPGVADPAPALERELLKEFRMSGAKHFAMDNVVDIYFMAQHFGMPTRLLDWTMNPLIALYFAVRSHPEEDGELFVMDALGVLPDTSKMKKEEADGIPTEILTMRDGPVEQSIGQSFWVRPVPANWPAYVTSATGYSTIIQNPSQRTDITGSARQSARKNGTAKCMLHASRHRR